MCDAEHVCVCAKDKNTLSNVTLLLVLLVIPARPLVIDSFDVGSGGVDGFLSNHRRYFVVCVVKPPIAAP